MDDRNLILGVLAAQAGFVTPAQVMAAASARMLAQDERSLLDHLVDSGAVTPARRDLVLTLAAEEALVAKGGRSERTLDSPQEQRPLAKRRSEPEPARAKQTPQPGSPFQGADNAQVIEAVLRGRPVPVRTLCPEAPPELSAIAQRALLLDAATGEALARIVAGRAGVGASQVNVLPSLQARISRGPRFWALLPLPRPDTTPPAESLRRALAEGGFRLRGVEIEAVSP